MLIVYDKFATKDDLTNDRKIQCVLKNIVSCIRTTALNGLYELEIKSVIDDNIINYVDRKSIIKSPSGQFYIVYWMQYDSSSKLVTIKCKHIFYYLAARMCEEKEHDNYNASYAILSVLFEYEQDPRLIEYKFDWSTDLDSDDNLHKINYYGKNKAQALVGDANSICNLYGGELYRDNFYFSIKKKMENSRENAFIIRDGWNTTGIRMTMDDTNTVTALWAEDNFGNIQGSSREIDGTFPYSTVRYQKFSYDDDKSYLAEDSTNYFRTYENPAISYDVSLVSIRNTFKDSPWLELENYGVGDSGIVWFDLIHHEDVQRITEQKYDELAEQTISVKLGSYRNSITNTDRYAKLLGKDDSAGRRLSALEAVIMSNKR